MGLSTEEVILLGEMLLAMDGKVSLVCLVLEPGYFRGLLG